ncbi:hypothetical protein ACFQI7_07655 [Paenibacillus allorhizosphaerae]|uniref:Pectate lyase superfamily protein domain-containing protein n=1 Tax=Paenibacillus allorhizosphaerae TaxID=2849866 RepID=A0ABM8VG65_9BACL|nr:hypothetical protein [Paenibacillus allorhizosphaerae]CAG7637358.1 hypothetical protein PAECIP111802_02349 [Paenibacillus allorhizosphaerae]
MELERDKKETTSMSRRTFFTGLGAAGIGLIAGSTLTGMGNAAAGQSVTDSVYGNNGDPPLGCCTEYNVKDKGAKADYFLADGTFNPNPTNNTLPFQQTFDAIETGGAVYIPAGAYYVTGNVTVSGKHVALIAEGVRLYGGGTFLLDAPTGAAGAASDVTAGDYRLTTAVSAAAGDFVEIAGTIAHSLYTPSRYAATKFIAKVVAAAEGTLTLDRNIMFSLTGVTVARITRPYTLHVSEGLSLHSVGMSVSRCIGGTVSVSMTGVRVASSSGIAVSKCCDLSLRVQATDLLSTHTVVLQDSNNVRLGVTAARCGQTDGSSVKVIRANGIQNATIDALCNGSLTGDSTIYGSRNVRLHIESVGSGRYNRETNVTGGNRLEAVQFSECNDITVTGSLTEVDDQAIEFLSVERGVIQAKVSTLPGSTEGAIVIKGKSKEVDIVNPVIRCWNPYGIKFEYVDGMQGYHKVIYPDIVNLNDTSHTGIFIRDAQTALDANVTVLGGVIEANTPFIVNPNHNKVTIKDTIIECKGGYGVQMNGDFGIVDNVAVTGTTTRAVVVNGANTTVSRVRSHSLLYVRSGVRPGFSIGKYRSNDVSQIYFDQGSWHIRASQGKYEAPSAPTEYAWSTGDVLYNQAPVETGAAGSKYIVTGWVCTASGTPGVWSQLRALTGN